MKGKRSMAAMLRETLDLIAALRGGRHGMTAWELHLVCGHSIASTYRELHRAEELGWVRQGKPRRGHGKDRVATTWWLTYAGSAFLETSLRWPF